MQRRSRNRQRLSSSIDMPPLTEKLMNALAHDVEACMRNTLIEDLAYFDARGKHGKWTILLTLMSAHRRLCTKYTGMIDRAKEHLRLNETQLLDRFTPLAEFVNVRVSINFVVHVLNHIYWQMVREAATSCGVFPENEQ